MPTITNDNYSWYTIVPADERIQQGDFFKDLTVLTPTTNNPDVPESIAIGTAVEQAAILTTINCIVMTHSCDFQETDITDSYLVLVCPYWEVSKVETVGKTDFIGENTWNSYVSGHKYGSHLLSEFQTADAISKSLNFNFVVVDISTVYTIPYGVLVSKKRERVRLLPPYREHMAQAFARNFMRVGLPLDLPRKRPY